MSAILIVDDNEQNVYLLQALLGGNGHEVLTAVNGAEALKIALATPPDLIISDILMPVMDGFVLCREWQADKRLQSIPFVFYTATYTEPKDEELALSLGAVRFIVKPEEPVRFMEIIREVLDDFSHATLPVAESPAMQEEVYLKEYNERLIHKLEQKTLALEKEIAERKLTEKQLRHAQKMEAIGTLAGGIAHDFNNILTAIIGFSEIAQAQLPPAHKIRPDLDKVINAGHRAASLVEQILTFSNQGNDDCQPLDLQQIVNEVLKLLQASLPVNIELQTSTTGETSLIMANPTQMHQVLMNLCTNARQAIGDRAGSISVSSSALQITDTETTGDCPQIPPGSYLHLEVTDNGCGMDEETQSKTFDPFFTTKEKGEGTGLGLAVVHGIIRQHHGEISVSSAIGQGTTFHVYLPLVDQAVQREVQDKRAVTADLPRGGEKVLFVDDEPDITEMTQRLLSDLGYRVTAFTSSVEALEVYKKKPDAFDLLVTDMVMPKMNGTELAAAIQSLKPGFPVILCTGYSESVDEKKAKSLGIQEFIRKPIINTTLAKAIRRVMNHV